jgi:hypothetical protein
MITVDRPHLEISLPIARHHITHHLAIREDAKVLVEVVEIMVVVRVVVQAEAVVVAAAALLVDQVDNLNELNI